MRRPRFARGRGSAEHERLISQLTYGRAAAPEAAQFQFVLAGSGTVHDALRGAPSGRWRSRIAAPRFSWRWTSFGSRARSVSRDPGQGQRPFGVDGLGRGWVELRAERCSEYPLGLDLYLVDGAGRLVGLPRTARLGNGG